MSYYISNSTNLKICKIGNISRNVATIVRLAGVVALLATLVLKGSAITTLPPASTFSEINSPDQSQTFCSNVGVVSSCSYNGATASAQISNGGFAQANTGADPSLAPLALARYGLSIVGPSGNSVPILISGISSASDNGATSYGIANVTLVDDTTPGYSVTQYFSSASGCAALIASAPFTPCTSPGAYTIQALLTPGDVYDIAVGAAATGGLNASATIDPSIVIDPSFANASNYSVIASPGVFGSTSPTTAPEPGTWVLTSISLFLVAWRGISSRKKSIPAFCILAVSMCLPILAVGAFPAIDPHPGVWKINLKNSHYNYRPLPQSETITITSEGSSFHIHFDVVEGHGKSHFTGSYVSENRRARRILRLSGRVEG